MFQVGQQCRLVQPWAVAGTDEVLVPVGTTVIVVEKPMLGADGRLRVSVPGNVPVAQMTLEQMLDLKIPGGVWVHWVAKQSYIFLPEDYLAPVLAN